MRERVLALLTPSASAQIVNYTFRRLTLTSGLSKGFANDCYEYNLSQKEADISFDLGIGLAF